MKKIVALLLLAFIACQSLFSQPKPWKEIESSVGYTVEYNTIVVNGTVYFIKQNSNNDVLFIYKQTGNVITQVGDSIILEEKNFDPGRIFVFNSNIYVLQNQQRNSNEGPMIVPTIYKLSGKTWKILPDVSREPTCSCTDLIEINNEVFISCYSKSEQYKASVYKQVAGKWNLVGEQGFSTPQPFGGKLTNYNNNPIFSYGYRAAKQTEMYAYMFDGKIWKNINTESYFVQPSSIVYDFSSSDNRIICSKRTTLKTNKLSMYEFANKKWIGLGNEFLETLDVKYSSFYVYKTTLYLVYQDKISNNTFILSYKEGKWSKPLPLLTESVELASNVFVSSGICYVFVKDNSSRTRLFKFQE